MKTKLLFAEARSYYDSLGILNDIDNDKFDMVFDGAKNYKIKDEDLKKYDYVISYLYTNPLSNLLIIKAKRNDIKTLLISDGIFDWNNAFENTMQKKYNLKLYHPIIHDHFLVVGDCEKDYFEKLGVKSSTFIPNRIISNKDIIKLPIKDKILITTANTAYFNQSEKTSLINLLKDVIKSISELNIDVIYRIFDDDLVRILQVKDEDNFKEGSFEETLKNASCVITTPSSICINSMYHGRSVGMLLYRDSPLFMQTGWLIHNSANIQSTILSMLARDSDRIMYQNYQVSNYVNDNNLSDLLTVENIKLTEDVVNKFVNQNYENLLNSRFNLNFEYFMRNRYLKLKKSKKCKNLISKLRLLLK